MQLNLNIGLSEIETILKQLAVSDLKKLNTTIRHEIIKKKRSKRINLQNLILKAPTWSDAQYNEYLAVREHLNKSRLA
jgi:hypothetical protein